jgi:hypothetical protein
MDPIKCRWTKFQIQNFRSWTYYRIRLWSQGYLHGHFLRHGLHYCPSDYPGIRDWCEFVSLFHMLQFFFSRPFNFCHFLQKLTRRLHLSKLRTSRFSESAQLACFYLVTLVWSVDISIFVRNEAIKHLNHSINDWIKGSISLLHCGI